MSKPFNVLTWMPSPVATTEGFREFMANGLAGMAYASNLPAIVAALAQYLADKDPNGILTVTYPKARKVVV